MDVQSDDGLAGPASAEVDARSEPERAREPVAARAADGSTTDVVADSLIRLGIVLVALAGGAAVWFVFASQSPTSPWAVASLPGPVDRLASTLATLGFGALLGAWLLPRAARSVMEARVVGVATYLGCLLHGGASFLAALYGGYGVQLTDPRPRSLAITSVRVAGMVVLGAVLLFFVVRLLGTRRASK